MEFKINQSFFSFIIIIVIFFFDYGESACVCRNASKQVYRADLATEQATKYKTMPLSWRQPVVSGPDALSASASASPRTVSFSLTRPALSQPPPPKSESPPPPPKTASAPSQPDSASPPPPPKPASPPPPNSASPPPPKSQSPPPPKSSSSPSPDSAPQAKPPPSSSSSPSSPPNSKSPPPAQPPMPAVQDSPDGSPLDGGIMGRGPGILAKIKPFLENPMPKIDAALTAICKETDFPHLCVSTLSPLFNGQTDPVSMITMAIKACAQHAQQSLETAQTIAKSPSTSSTIASKLSDCKDNYQDALDNLQAAADSIITGDLGRVNSMLSAVVTDASDCQDSFPGNSSPMLDYEIKLQQMASNCLAITALATGTTTRV